MAGNGTWPSGMFIRCEVDEPAASDRDVAKQLAAVCPVDIYADAGEHVAIAEENLDECTCRDDVDRQTARPAAGIEEQGKARQRPASAPPHDGIDGSRGSAGERTAQAGAAAEDTGLGDHGIASSLTPQRRDFWAKDVV